METAPPAGRLTPHVALRRITAVVNTASGSVGADAADRLREVASTYGLEITVHTLEGAGLEPGMRRALDENPDAVVVMGGDGTFARCASLCGPEGPLLAALPGGTMNMLPHALSGRRLWPDALRAILETGREMKVSGGEVAGRRFYVAAILGAPALWADAREAVRRGRFALAFLRGRRALLRAFKGRLRFAFEGGPPQKAEALSLMCPLVSRGLDRDVGLEAAVLDPRGALDAFRLGLSTLIGAWRRDPAVRLTVCTRGDAWAHGLVPSILDGEPHRLESPVHFTYVPDAFRALVPSDCELLQMREAVEAQTGQVDAPLARGVVQVEAR